MAKLIDYAINHARLTVATPIFLLCAGLVSYVTIPKEAEPDVKIPIIYVQLSQRGISPERGTRVASTGASGTETSAVMPSGILASALGNSISIR